MQEELDIYDLIYIREFEAWSRKKEYGIKSNKFNYILTKIKQDTDLILTI